MERKLEDQPVTQHPVGSRYSFHGLNGSVRAEHGVVIFPELPGHFERKKVKVGLADELFFSLLEKTLKRSVVIDEPAFGVFHESDGRTVVHKRMKALLFFFQILLGLLPLSNVRDNPVKAKNVLIAANHDAVVHPSQAAVGQKQSVVLLVGLASRQPSEGLGPTSLIVRMDQAPPAMDPLHEVFRRVPGNPLRYGRKITIDTLAAVIDFRAPQAIRYGGHHSA